MGGWREGTSAPPPLLKGWKVGAAGQFRGPGSSPAQDVSYLRCGSCLPASPFQTRDPVIPHWPRGLCRGWHTGAGTGNQHSRGPPQLPANTGFLAEQETGGFWETLRTLREMAVVGEDCGRGQSLNTCPSMWDELGWRQATPTGAPGNVHLWPAHLHPNRSLCRGYSAAYRLRGMG